MKNGWISFIIEFIQWDIKRHKFSNKRNPFLLIGKIPAVKRKFEEQETSHQDVVNKVWRDKRYGFSKMISGGVTVVVLSFLIWGLLSTFLGLFKVYFFVKPIYVIAYGLVSFLVCHLLVFRQDKYIEYFKKLDNQSKQEKWQNAIVSLFIVIGSIALWLYSFQFTPILGGFANHAFSKLNCKLLLLALRSVTS